MQRVCTIRLCPIISNHNYLYKTSQHAFRTSHLPLPPLDPRTGHPTRASQRLKRALRPMVVVTAADHVDMERDPGRHRPAAERVMDHLAVQLADRRALEVEAADEERAGGDVKDGAGEGLVEGRVAVAEAGEAGAGAEGRGEGGAEGEEGVFGRVVVVDWSVFSFRSSPVEKSGRGKTKGGEGWGRDTG